MHLAPDILRMRVTFSPPLPMTVAASALEMMDLTCSQDVSSVVAAAPWPLDARSDEVDGMA